MPPQNRILFQRARILPSLPVKKSVLRQLGIADNEWPHGLRRLKHNLLLSPSHTRSQGSDICTNLGPNVFGEFHLDGRELSKRLWDTIAEGPIARRRDEDCLASKEKIFMSLSYLDQIAFVCLASGLRACQAPDCLQYQRKMERVVPVCHSWPGLRDWVLCMVSCSLRACNMDGSEGNEMREPCHYKHNHQYGPEIFRRCWAHLSICILLTMATIPSARTFLHSTYSFKTMAPGTGTGNESGSIDGLRPGQSIYSVEWMSVSSRRCPRCTPEYF